MDDKLKEELENYNLLKSDAKSAFKDKKYEKALDYVHIAAKMGMQSHLGLWYDDELEELLSKIGMDLKPVRKKGKENKKRIYILTYLTDDRGTCLGHCQAFKQWAKILGGDKIYITNGYTAHGYSSNGNHLKNIPIHTLSWQDSYTERIGELIQNINQDSPDEIILFINPDDVIAISALYALDKRSRIIFFNHADHSYWLGRNLIDTLIEFRDEGIESSKKYRNIYNSQMVPLITKIEPKIVSRNDWDIKKGSTVSLSIGNILKVIDDNMDYFKLIDMLLQEYPNHYHVLITNHFNRNIIKTCFRDYQSIKDRLVIAGPLKDLSRVYGLGDFLIETFPLNGDTVRMEAMACKLPVVAYYNNKFPLAAARDYLPSDYSFIGSNNDELMDHCRKLIEDTELKFKTGEKLYRHYLKEFTYENIAKTLKNVISSENRISIKSGEINIDYDLDYVRKLLIKNKMELNKQLLFQSIFKPSKFAIGEKINFYVQAIKKSEFQSKKHAVSYFFLPFVGFKGIELGIKFGNKGISLYNGLFVK